MAADNTTGLLDKKDLAADAADEVIFGLIKERKRKNLSRNRLAGEAGVSPETVKSLEEFRAGPSLKTCLLLAHAMGMTLRLEPLGKDVM